MKSNRRSRKYPTLENYLDKRASMAVLPVSSLFLEILVLMLCLRHHSKAIHEPPTMSLCSSFWSHSCFGFLSFQQQEAPWTNCALPGQRHNTPNNAHTDGVLAFLPALLIPSYNRRAPYPLLATIARAADSHGRDAKQPVRHRHHELSMGTEDMPRALIQPATLCWPAHSPSSCTANINQSMEKEGFQLMPVLCSGNHCSYRAYPNASSESPSTPTLPTVFSVTICIFLPFFRDREG